MGCSAKTITIEPIKTVIEKPVKIVIEKPVIKNPTIEKLPIKWFVYIVGTWEKDGDCLWVIAERLYGDKWQWKKIYLANKDQIKDPNLIYPNQRLTIPDIEQ